ncbi:hypothetical protein EYZ11_001332 [Aspergillus tanneri]|nr:hypothetical protein EYZ11_001332 [Aspergillus tanneri]
MSPRQSPLPFGGTQLDEWDFGYSAGFFREGNSHDNDVLGIFSREVQLPSTFHHPASVPSSNQVPVYANSWTTATPATSVSTESTTTTTTPRSSTTTVSSSPSSYSPRPCACQRDIVRKLAEFNARNLQDGMLLDDILTENKASMAVCRSVMECCDLQHNNDLLLQVELAALLGHMIAVWDRAFQYLSDPSFQSVRFTFGSYQLDQPEERLLQTNLVKIEMAKMSSLLDDFDRRFCASNNSRPGDNPHPAASLLAHLKQKLQFDFEIPPSWTSWR